ncbi:MAG TPA: hypothetical protein DDW50_07280 [Firmicutes bacterium]|nr:hypothetical protein [Bacillota bacterium]
MLCSYRFKCKFVSFPDSVNVSYNLTFGNVGAELYTFQKHLPSLPSQNLTYKKNRMIRFFKEKNFMSLIF